MIELYFIRNLRTNDRSDFKLLASAMCVACIPCVNSGEETTVQLVKPRNLNTWN